jgi:hypothetical protein
MVPFVAALSLWSDSEAQAAGRRVGGILRPGSGSCSLSQLRHSLSGLEAFSEDRTSAMAKSCDAAKVPPDLIPAHPLYCCAGEG